MSNSSLLQKKETCRWKFLSGSSSEHEIVLVNIRDDNSGGCDDICDDNNGGCDDNT